MNSNLILNPPTGQPQSRSLRRSRVSRRHRVGQALGSASLLLACVAIGLTLCADPYWLAGPTALVAIVLAQFVLGRYNESQLWALLASALGMCSLMLWLVIDIVMRYMLGFDFSVMHTVRSILAP